MIFRAPGHAERKASLFLLVVAGLVLAAVSTKADQSAAVKRAKKQLTLFNNIYVFDGKAEKRIMNANVLVEGNPLEDINLIANTEEKFVLIMKDGNIYKNNI